jgi:DNA-binding CsgD family transcriptional regulator
MLECSARVVRLFLDQMARGPLSTEMLCSGLNVQGPSNLVDWNVYSALADRSAEALGGPERLEEVCEATFNLALPEGHHLMTLAADPAAGMELMNAFVDASFFAHFRYPMTRLGERRFRLSVSLPRGEGYRPSSAFFHGVAGNLRAATRFAGLAPSTVRKSIRPYSADYEITLPKMRTATAGDAASRAGQKARALFIDHCRNELERVRQTFEEARRLATLAAKSTAFEALSQAVAPALLGQEREVMPLAAVKAIAEALGCGRVAIKWFDGTNPKPLVLAATGDGARRVLSVEVETSSGLLVFEAAVAKNSVEASALRLLVPWLAMLFGSAGPAESPRSADWKQTRLAALAVRWRLTPRQRQVLWLMAHGESNKRIAQQLGCAEGTVELHAGAILLKSGSSSRAGLAAHFFAGP